MITDETPKAVYQLKGTPHAKNYIAGIDPDCEKSGVAIWSRLTDGYTCLETETFAGLVDRLRFYAPDELLIIVEAGQNNEGFHHYKGLPKGFHTWGQKQQWAYMFKIGSQTGRNFYAGEVIAHFFRANGYEVEEYTPKAAKWDADLFKRITGLGKGYNQEIRDAVRCIHGR